MLHLSEGRCQGAFCLQQVESALGCAHRKPQQRYGVDHDVHADIRELLPSEQVALAELRHVREDRHVDGCAHRFELREVDHRFGKDRVGPRIHQRLRSVYRGR